MLIDSLLADKVEQISVVKCLFFRANKYIDLITLSCKPEIIEMLERLQIYLNYVFNVLPELQ